MTSTSVNLVISGQDYGRRRSYPAGAEHFYEGQLLFIDASDGYVTADSEAAANKFIGIAAEEVDNSGGSNGDLNIEVFTEGNFRHLVYSGTAAQTTVGLKIYAVDADNQTLVSTTGSGGNTFVGYCTEFISATKIALEIETDSPAAGP